MDLQIATQHLRLLSDSTRIRLLFLLEKEELSVAELAAITQLAQPRVSTHLARLKEAHLVNDRRDGVSVFYRLASEPDDQALAALWQVLKEQTRDPLAEQDLERIAAGACSAQRRSATGPMPLPATWSATILRAEPGKPPAAPSLNC